MSTKAEDSVQGRINVSPSGTTVYANRQFLIALSDLLRDIANSNPTTCHEIHLPDALYLDPMMFAEGAAKNVVVEMSPESSALFSKVPHFTDVDGEVLSPQYTITFMHCVDPLAQERYAQQILS